MAAIAMIGTALGVAWWGPAWLDSAPWSEGPAWAQASDGQASDSEASRTADRRWPETGVTPPAELRLPAHFAARRVYLDAGHGAHDNRGNTSAFCEEEQDFTLSLAEDTRRFLLSWGFEVEVSRDDGELVDYRARVREAEHWGADVFVSLHSDVRGDGERWQPTRGQTCLRNRSAPGFVVIASDDRRGAGQTLALARATARHLERIGLPAYDGRHYGPIYEEHPEQPGVFVDRHPPEEKIFVLWRPTMPSILVETHHALDDREAARWREPETRRAFASALAAAMIEVLDRPR